MVIIYYILLLEGFYLKFLYDKITAIICKSSKIIFNKISILTDLFAIHIISKIIYN